ncbi:PAS domain-containing protein [Rhizobium sp. SRDI969]|uniref:PAS domain-containing protein n=1 Tax=Rhizobium sp. SRDI969 TaxID=3138252 RepID=UPI0021A7CA8A|nr:PAS domain-containing protein [Rhizobium leguminosarum]UWM82462.1 PAS domain-containing protein [Rhizobium leguminosarum bv. viciae]
MQRFILRQNIGRFRTLLLEQRNEHDTHVLKVMLSRAVRNLAILEAADGFEAEIDPLHAEVQRRIFRDSFEHSSIPHLLLDPRKGLHIVDINTAYEKATLTSAAKIAGSCMFDVFPDKPSDEEADGVSNLHASLKHAAEEGVPNAMHIQRYDVRDASGLFVTKFWKPVNSPIFDAQGRLLYLLHQVEDVTDAIQKRTAEADGSP